MTQKEHIMAFDRELVQADDYRRKVPNVVSALMAVFGCGCMLFPINSQKANGVFFIFPLFFLGMAVILKMQTYVYINNTVQIEPVLAYLPVDKTVFRRVRRSYLFHYLCKLGLVMFVLQQYGAVHKKCWSAYNLFYPAAMLVFLSMVGLTYIRVSSTKKVTVREGVFGILGITASALALLFFYPISFDISPKEINGGSWMNMDSTSTYRSPQMTTSTRLSLCIEADSEEYRAVAELLGSCRYHLGLSSIFNNSLENRDNANQGWNLVTISLEHEIYIFDNGNISIDGKRYVLYGGEERAWQLVGDLFDILRNSPNRVRTVDTTIADGS